MYDIEQLRELYVTQGLRIKEIESKLGISRSTIYRLCREHGITRQRPTYSGCDASNFQGYGQLGMNTWNRIKRKAEERNLEVLLTIEEAWELYEQQGRKCALSGIELNMVDNRRSTKDPTERTASLDRKDCSKPYTKDNVQWVHKTINIMKNTLTDEQFIYFCKQVSETN